VTQSLDCTVHRHPDGWRFAIGDQCGGPYQGPLEAAAAAERAAKADGRLAPVDVLWFQLG
jgi:hypothetical protein